MKPDIKKKLARAKEKFGVDIRINTDLDKYSDVVLFPEKLAHANKMLAKLKFKPLD